jgi:type IV secretory pathway TraG/TraD family ATPase VirD4
MRPASTPAHVSEHGAEIGRLVSGRLWLRGRRVYSPWCRGTLVWGPQGSGKTSWLVTPILQAPGAAYVSSTKLELVTMTAGQRAHRGPVAVFNPTGLGRLVSSFGWNPVEGCQDAAIADARARALVRGGGGVSGAKNASFWENKAAEIVRCYLLAAALYDADMGEVMRWALSDDLTPQQILEQEGPRVPAGWLGALKKNLTAAPETVSGYMAGVIPAVSFMDNHQVARACRPRPTERFDIAEFLGKGGTLYVIAGEQDRRVAPLITALTEAVFATAKQIAANASQGRLDPPLSMFLDEVANSTPVPLDHWAADSRGWGITVTAVVQDLGQLRARWGAERAQTIFSNLPTKVVLPGVAIKDDLEDLAYLAGQRTIRQTSEHHGATGEKKPRSRTISRAREAVIPGHVIYRLPRWHAYVLGLGPRPAVVRFTPGYRIAARQARTVTTGSGNRGPHGVPTTSRTRQTPRVEHEHNRAPEQEAA